MKNPFAINQFHWNPPSVRSVKGPQRTTCWVPLPAVADSMCRPSAMQKHKRIRYSVAVFPVPLAEGTHTHLVDGEVRNKKQTVSVLWHFGDFDVKLQVSDREVAEVLDLRCNNI